MDPLPDGTTVTDPPTEPTTTSPNPAGDVDGLGPPDPPNRRPDPPAGTRTASSSPVSKPTAAEAAKLVAGILGLVVAGVAAVVAWRGRRELRRPTGQQLDDIAAPLARIAVRHVPAELLNADLADGLLAAGAIGAYLGDGKLIRPPTIDAGVPDNLAELEA